MTDTHDKIRALFLSALMVFSVFAGTVAFAGTAAAASGIDTDASSVTLSSVNELQAGGSSSTVTVTAVVDDVDTSNSTTGATANVTFEDGISLASSPGVTNVGVNGSTTSSSSSFDGENDTVTVSFDDDTTGGSTTEDIKIEFDVDIVGDDINENRDVGVSVEADGDNSGGPEVSSTEIGTVTVDGGESSVATAAEVDGDIEISFDEAVQAGDGDNLGLDNASDGNTNISVALNGNNVTGEFSIDSRPDDGRLLLGSDLTINPQDDLTVNIDTVEDNSGNEAG